MTLLCRGCFFFNNLHGLTSHGVKKSESLRTIKPIQNYADFCHEGAVQKLLAVRKAVGGGSRALPIGS